MSGALGILSFVVVIVLVILVHEAAHFVAAGRFGIKVEEFFVGFGPRLWSFRRGETEYGVKALPLGGYVRIAGMNPFQEPSPEDLPRTFGAKPIWQRAVVIAAGPLTHFVLAAVFFAALLAFVGRPTDVRPVVGGVEPTLEGGVSPARQAGLRPGDQVVAVDGRRDPTMGELVDYTQSHVGREIELTVLREGREVDVAVTPVLAELDGQTQGRIGVVLTEALEREGLLESLGGGVAAVGRASVFVIENLGKVFGPEGLARMGDLLFGDAPREVTDATSVVGGARVAGQAASTGNFGILLGLFATFNVFIGILNLLPLLPFDGGHLAVLAAEKVWGRPVDARRLVPITAAVAAFLVVYMVGLVYLDITKPVPDLFR